MRFAVWVVGGLIGVPLLLIGVAVFVVAPLALVGLRGSVVDLSGLGPHTVGVRATGGGVAVDHASCDTNAMYSSLVVRAADGRIVWRADAMGQVPAPLQLTLGTAPAGFHDVVPLTGPLDPHDTYAVELTLIQPSDGVSTNPAALIGAGTATFRPADLRPGRVWFEGRLTTAGEFERLACDAIVQA